MMQIGLDELFRETTGGDWSLAAFWLPPIFWRYLLSDQGTALWEVQEVVEVVQQYHLFLVRATRRLPEGGLETLPPSRLRSFLTLKDGSGAEQRVLKQKLPPQMKGLVTALTEAVNQGNTLPFLPVIFPAGGEETSFLFPRVRGELQLCARRREAEELSMRWQTLPAPPEPPRPRPRRRGELRRA
jgi:hypothetical protein